MAAMPTAESEAPAMKLAEAEKHIGHDPFVARTSVHPTSKELRARLSLGHAADGGTLWAKVNRAERANLNSQNVEIPAIVLNNEQF